jgi:hypothetical protein
MIKVTVRTIDYAPFIIQAISHRRSRGFEEKLGKMNLIKIETVVS